MLNIHADLHFFSFKKKKAQDTRFCGKTASASFQSENRAVRKASQHKAKSSCCCTGAEQLLREGQRERVSANFLSEAPEAPEDPEDCFP